MKYDDLDVEIRDVQKVQLEILREFDRICEKYNIKYQLFAGTLLGAIRHKGFIPWDDDIDVCLLRTDYDRFIQVCESELSSQYFLQTYETDKNYVNQFAKIRKNDTIFLEKTISNCKMHHGIFIDIFPMDNILPKTFIGEVQRRVLDFLRTVNRTRIKQICLNTRNPIKRCIVLINHYIIKLIPKSWIDRLQTKIACMFQNKETEYVSHLTNGVSKSTYSRYMMKKDDFYDIIDGEFEGHTFPIPKNYDSVLTRLFGDYMLPPPIEKQKPHHGIIEINFDTKRYYSCSNITKDGEQKTS